MKSNTRNRHSRIEPKGRFLFSPQYKCKRSMGPIVFSRLAYEWSCTLPCSWEENDFYLCARRKNNNYIQVSKSIIKSNAQEHLGDTSIYWNALQTHVNINILKSFSNRKTTNFSTCMRLWVIQIQTPQNSVPHFSTQGI